MLSHSLSMTLIFSVLINLVNLSIWQCCDCAQPRHTRSFGACLHQPTRHLVCCEWPKKVAACENSWKFYWKDLKRQITLQVNIVCISHTFNSNSMWLHDHDLTVSMMPILSTIAAVSTRESMIETCTFVVLHSDSPPQLVVSTSLKNIGYRGSSAQIW